MVAGESTAAAEAGTWAGAAGQRGADVRSDCWIGIAPRESGGLELRVTSTVAAYYGDAIRGQVEAGARALGLEHAAIAVEDGGALPWVIDARLEVAARRALGDRVGRVAPDAAAPAPEPRRVRLRRSRLYLPGNEPRYMINAGLHRPDAVILDLEDSVAATEKDAARVLVRNALVALDFGPAERMVRINPGDEGLRDLDEVLAAGVELLLLPKAESAEYVRALDSAVRQRTEREVLLMPIVESAKGVVNAPAIAGASERVVALTIGLEDYTADLGTRRSEEGTESLWARSMVVNAARAHGLQAIDSVYSDVGNEDGLRASLREAKALGFEGKGCIHPRQIRVVHDELAPDPAEVERALAVVRAFEDARARGLGVVSLGTKMIDPPVVHRAVRTVELARALGRLPAGE